MNRADKAHMLAVDCVVAAYLTRILKDPNCANLVARNQRSPPCSNKTSSLIVLII